MHSPWTWVIVLGIAVVGGGYLLYRRSKAAAATTTPTAATPAGTTTPDWSGEIATLQTEIMDLQSSESQAQAADKKEDKTGDDDDDDDDKDDKGKHHKPPRSNLVTVPNVVGKSQEDAIDDLGDVGLRSAGQTPVHAKVRIVTAQHPKGGAKVRKGTVVHLTTKLTPASKKPRRPRRPVPKTHHHHVHRRAAALCLPAGQLPTSTAPPTRPTTARPRSTSSCTSISTRRRRGGRNWPGPAAA